MPNVTKCLLAHTVHGPYRVYKAPHTLGPHLPAEPRLHQKPFHGLEGGRQTVDIATLVHGPLWVDCLTETEWITGHLQNQIYSKLRHVMFPLFDAVMLCVM
jgi:hypothetical protein